MTHEELLKKYNVNASEFNEQKEEIANIFLKELANMQHAEAEGMVLKYFNESYPELQKKLCFCEHNL